MPANRCGKAVPNSSWSYNSKPADINDLAMKPPDAVFDVDGADREDRIIHPILQGNFGLGRMSKESWLRDGRSSSTVGRRIGQSPHFEQASRDQSHFVFQMQDVGPADPGQEVEAEICRVGSKTAGICFQLEEVAADNWSAPVTASATGGAIHGGLARMLSVSGGYSSQALASGRSAAAATINRGAGDGFDIGAAIGQVRIG